MPYQNPNKNIVYIFQFMYTIYVSLSFSHVYLYSSYFLMSNVTCLKSVLRFCKGFVACTLSHIHILHYYSGMEEARWLLVT